MLDCERQKVKKFKNLVEKQWNIFLQTSLLYVKKRKIHLKKKRKKEKETRLQFAAKLTKIKHGETEKQIMCDSFGEKWE